MAYEIEAPSSIPNIFCHTLASSVHYFIYTLQQIIISKIIETRTHKSVTSKRLAQFSILIVWAR